jgi:hypothetical protein
MEGCRRLLTVLMAVLVLVVMVFIFGVLLSDIAYVVDRTCERGVAGVRWSLNSPT